MRSMLSTLQRDRLVKILGMLGSEHVGERASAARAADQFVKDLGATWNDVLTPMIQDRAMPGPVHRHEPQPSPGPTPRPTPQSRKRAPRPPPKTPEEKAERKAERERKA